MSPKTYKYFSSSLFLLINNIYCEYIYNPHELPVYYVMQRPGKGNARIVASTTRKAIVQQTRALRPMVAVAAMIMAMCARIARTTRRTWR